TWPDTSIGSRTAKPTFRTSTLAASMPFAFTKIGHCAKAPSAAGAPSFLPSRSLGGALPRRLAVTTANGGVAVVETRGLRGVVGELDEGVDVRECHVVGARRDAVDRLDRAARGIDGHVEAFGLEVAAVERQQEGRLRAFIFPVERKLHRGLRERGSGKTERDG